MANYLFLRGNRNKRFFTDIANELIDKGHHCYQIKFELGELLFKGNIHSIYAPFYISKKQYPISNQTLLNMQIYNITYQKKIMKKSINDRELRMYKRYMYFIDKYIEEKNIEVICFFNGYHWIDQVTKVIAERRDLKTFIFEDGLFRPYTLTCDQKGINAKGSVPTSAEFYDSLSIDRDRLKKYLFKPEDIELEHKTNERLILVALLKGINMVGNLLKINPKLYTHINFWQAFKYFVFKKSFKLRRANTLKLPTEYIFIPFQVARDTQIFYNSPNIDNMEQLVEIALRAVGELNNTENRNVKIIVKEHPEDMSRNNYSSLKKRYKDNENIVFLQKYDINQLIKNALMVVTINSTVGIEALAQFKKVVTLGEASYNIDGISFKCTNPSKLGAVLRKVLKTEINKERIDKFLYYLRFHYQIEGTINSKSEVTAKNIAKKIAS